MYDETPVERQLLNFESSVGSIRSRWFPALWTSLDTSFVCHPASRKFVRASDCVHLKAPDPGCPLGGLQDICPNYVVIMSRLCSIL